AGSAPSGVRPAACSVRLAPGGTSRLVQLRRSHIPLNAIALDDLPAPGGILRTGALDDPKLVYVDRGAFAACGHWHPIHDRSSAMLRETMPDTRNETGEFAHLTRAL